MLVTKIRMADMSDEDPEMSVMMVVAILKKSTIAITVKNACLSHLAPTQEPTKYEPIQTTNVLIGAITEEK